MIELTLPQPYLLFLGDVRAAAFAKTAFGLRDWAPARCIGEYALTSATITTGLPALTPAEAGRRGARALVIGVAAPGGVITPAWIPALREALEAGLDLISGMHTPLAQSAELKLTAERLGRRLIDVRRPPGDLPVGTGRKRSGQRLLTVGTDCALGKKYSALALTRAFKARNVSADFRATGQTGIMIAGAGIPIDAVVCDFVAGAAEVLSPDAALDHWDVVEGQGSLFHPSYAAVSLGLLHGTQPDVIVMCHEVGRTHVIGVPGYALPSVEEAIELNLMLARRVNPAVRCAGLSLNTAKLSEPEASAVLARESARLGMPVADPIRGGAQFDRLVAACLGV
jgi:D-glutamate N-acetyltransferase